MFRILRQPSRRLPLHVHISVLFALLLILAGAALGLFNYRQTSQIIFSSGDQLFEKIRHDVEKDLQYTYQPIRHLLALLALDQAAQAPDLERRLDLLPALAQALRDNPQLASLYIGYADGDFFMVRPLRSAALRERFEAPAQALFQVWSIDHDEVAGTQAAYLFFDDSLQLISQRPLPEGNYDPRSRAWYQSARGDAGQITTRPYLFFSSEEVGTTLARRAGRDGVIAADLTLADLSATLAQHRVTPSTELVLFDPAGDVVAYPDSQRLLERSAQGLRQARAAELSPALAALLAGNAKNSSQAVLLLDQRRWVVSRSHLQEGGPHGLDLALLVPEDELLADAYRIRWQGGLITLGVLLLSLPLGWLSSRIVVRPLRALVGEAEAIRSFDFSRSDCGRSLVLEVDELALSMGHMKQSLASFMKITAGLSSETHFATLLNRVLRETVEIVEVAGGLLYLVDTDSGRLEPQGLILDGAVQSLADYPLRAYDSAAAMPEWLRQPCAGGASQSRSLGFDQLDDYQALLRVLDCPRINLLASGLHNPSGSTLGVLVLFQRDTGLPASRALFRAEHIAFVEAISGVAAMCIDSQRLLERQKRLLDSFIQLIAGAIDAKSPYTGGHCQRVPELTLMLARAAAEDKQQFAAYQPDEDDWEALHIAAWLHDCGKVTTPEYVVDKATKLETLYDRIHEIRMRFEVLKRDAWIAYWRGRAEGADDQQLIALRERTLRTLDDEFAFVARCNLGSENMAKADLERLGTIARRSWTRTLDDRLGISWEEQQRQARTPPASLPVAEPLLADKPEHLFIRPDNEQIAADNPWGFKVDAPRYKFNRGELYNLSVRRGTLTPEERYIINGHMLQTIRMLDQLPFPPRLKDVPEIAGGHHERMDGNGYPKRLNGEQLSLPARMMAIADIFEALTAVDRPYKKGKTLSQSLAIMAGMSRNGHIDPQLFALFVRAGVYRDYARRFLADEQIDPVDEQGLLQQISI